MELEWPYKRHYETFAGIQEFAINHGEWELHLSVFPHLEIAQGMRFDGILGRITKSCYQAAQDAHIPVVNVWFDSPVRQQLSGVYHDFHAAGQMAAEHLINRGFQQLAHMGYLDSQSSANHYQGMLETAKTHGLECAQFLTRMGYSDQEKYWQDFVGQIGKMHEEWRPPVGIGCFQDELGHSTINLLLEHGWRCPEDLAIIGTHNEFLICNATSPSLSSIEIPHRTCGYKAARLLNTLIDEPDTPQTTVYIQPKEPVIRGSSDAYAVDDPVMVTALRFMAENLSQRISVPDIALAAGVGRQSLERRFRKQLKRTINDELIRLRISKMKRLLVGTDVTVGEISYQVGFGTTANMNLMFKRHTGMPPLAYRKKYSPKSSP